MTERCPNCGASVYDPRAKRLAGLIGLTFATVVFILGVFVGVVIVGLR